jgi:hypothetical protein
MLSLSNQAFSAILKILSDLPKILDGIGIIFFDFTPTVLFL